MSHELLDLEEWGLVLNKMLKFHFNISEEIKAVVQVSYISGAQLGRILQDFKSGS